MEFITTICWLLYYIVASFLAIYIPGRVVLGKSTKFPPFVLNVISISVGIALFGWQGYIFGTLHARWMTYVYIVIFLLVYILKKYYPQKFSFSFKSVDKISASIISIGVLFQTISYIRMGWMTSQGIIIAAHNDGDHIWHATLTNELTQRFPPHEPGIAGVVLKDYHYFFNLITADLIRVFHLPLFTTQFLGMYIGGSILFGLLSYILLKSIYPSKLFIRLGLFLLFFAGNAAGWYMLASSHVLDWSILSLIVDQTKFLDSPAYAYAILIGFTGLFFLLQKQLQWRYVAIVALCFGSLIEYKVYVGITFFAGFGCYVLYQMLRRNIKITASFVLAVLFGLCVFIPGLSKNGGLVFIPFDIPRDFINQSILGHADWQLRWVIFQDHHNTLRIIQLGLMMTGLYFIIQYGLLLLGLVPYVATLKKLKSFSLFFYSAIIVSMLLGVFFYQKVGGANIWEFFLAGIPLIIILFALHITLLVEKKKAIVKFLVIVFIAIIVIPQSLISFNQYINEEFFTPFHGLSNAEVDSLKYIASNTPKESVALILGQQKYVAYSSIDRIFADRDLYLSGEGVRQQVTPVIKHRKEFVAQVQSMISPKEIASALNQEHISYLYVYNDINTGIHGDSEHLIKVFTNKAATIYKVQ